MDHEHLVLGLLARANARAPASTSELLGVMLALFVHKNACRHRRIITLK